MTESRRYLVRNLGCKANLYDAQLIEAELAKRGWIPADPADDPESVDLCVVNSCTVTDEADRQSRKSATRLARMSPGAKIVMTGCGAEVDPEGMRATPGVDYVIGNQDKPALLDMILRAMDAPVSDSAVGTDSSFVNGTVLGSVRNYDQMASRHPMDREWPLPEHSFFTPKPRVDGEGSRTRAFLKVQDGCNAFCTYCIIPYGRGPARSLGIAEVVGQVRELVEQGIREVVITGVNIGDYGVDWAKQPMHAELFSSILRETSLERLRVSSLDPTEITEDVLELMRSEPRFCPHFHVSLQSPHSRVLKLMKRKYGFNEVKHCLEAIAQLGKVHAGAEPFIGMDVITGFPGESQEEFDWGVDALRALPWTRLHVFPYSERTGTPATRLPGSVPQAERVRRAKILRELSFERLRERHQREHEALRDDGSGVLREVLLERPIRGPDGKKWLAGYTPNYLRVMVPLRAAVPNELISARVHSVTFDSASGDCAFIGEKA